MENIIRKFDPIATGDLLRQKREEVRLSQLQLVGRLSMQGYDISANSPGIWERGEKNISLQNLLILAQFYGCTLDKLVITSL